MLLAIESAVIVLVGISNAIGIQYLLPTNQTHPFTVSVILGAVTNIILNIPMIIAWGAIGAMIATVFSEAVVSLYQLVRIRHQMNVSRLFAETWKYLLSATLMGIYISWYMRFMPLRNLVKLTSAVILGALIYVLILLLLKPHKLIDMVRDLKKTRV